MAGWLEGSTWPQCCSLLKQSRRDSVREFTASFLLMTDSWCYGQMDMNKYSMISNRIGILRGTWIVPLAEGQHDLHWEQLFSMAHYQSEVWAHLLMRWFCFLSTLCRTWRQKLKTATIWARNMRLINIIKQQLLKKVYPNLWPVVYFNQSTSFSIKLVSLLMWIKLDLNVTMLIKSINDCQVLVAWIRCFFRLIHLMERFLFYCN